MNADDLTAEGADAVLACPRIGLSLLRRRIRFNWYDELEQAVHQPKGQEGDERGTNLVGECPLVARVDQHHTVQQCHKKDAQRHDELSVLLVASIDRNQAQDCDQVKAVYKNHNNRLVLHNISLLSDLKRLWVFSLTSYA